ncbi:MAG TPA: DUF692 family protein [Nitrospiraceae bacterium]|nr:DUF692 family protein [Nitrospiraceae bacterium]
MMTSIERTFIRRLSRIPSHGLGLSVDVYSPNLFDLSEAVVSNGLRYDYLEIFQASQSALAEVRRRLPDALLEYHAEGLWLTQPEWGTDDDLAHALSGTASHLATLGSYWINHECATKQMAGLSFGTYLPALFTAASADVTAAHATRLQYSLAGSGQFAVSREPLVLLEIPPLTYFAFGDMPVTEFFSRIAARMPCGFVLDLGHVWTYYRYSGEWRRRSVTAFLTEFLDAFPLERVVQIHIAGLAVHESAIGNASEDRCDDEAPFWIDAHHAPIPEVLWDMLDQVLAHPKLRALKGLALEIDTKSIGQIVHELHQVQQRFGERVTAVCDAVQTAPVPSVLHDDSTSDSIAIEPTADAVNALRHQYEDYSRVVSGHISASQAGLPSRWLEPGNLAVYRQMYLPHEILGWGGDVHDMFPETCRALVQEGIDVSAFVGFWFREPRPLNQPYDFFLLKVDRFPRFVREVLPAAFPRAMREADALRDAYQIACDDVVQPEEAHS